MAYNKPVYRFTGPYAFLSNFHDEHAFMFDGKRWKTSEHAFQSRKTEDKRWQKLIWQADSPGKAKQLGRVCPLREDWDYVKIAEMKDVLVAKFQVPEYRKLLLATGRKTLVEGNGHGDDYWGKIRRGDKWVGENWLGRLLMLIRDDILLEIP